MGFSNQMNQNVKLKAPEGSYTSFLYSPLHVWCEKQSSFQKASVTHVHNLWNVTEELVVMDIWWLRSSSKPGGEHSSAFPGFSLQCGASCGQSSCSQDETRLLIAVQLQRLIGRGVTQKHHSRDNHAYSKILQSFRPRWGSSCLQQGSGNLLNVNVIWNLPPLCIRNNLSSDHKSHPQITPSPPSRTQDCFKVLLLVSKDLNSFSSQN